MTDLVPLGAQRATHTALPYATTEEFLAGVLTFVTAGLEHGEPVLAAVPATRIALIRERLDGRDDRVSWADMARLGANPAWIIPRMLDFVSAHPGRPTRCLQEPLWAQRTAAERRETLRHEALINVAFAGTPVTILCLYDTEQLGQAVVTSAGRAHPALMREGRTQPSPGYDTAAVFPAECDRPLHPPPDTAAVLGYRADLSAVREFIARHARSAGLAPRRARDLILAASELAANTFRHTRSGGRVTIWAAAGELICQITDSGHISDALAGRRAAHRRRRDGYPPALPSDPRCSDSVTARIRSGMPRDPVSPLSGRVSPRSPTHSQCGQGEGAKEYDDSDDQQIQQAFGDHANNTQHNRRDH